MRLDHGRLMHQFVASLRLADRANREGPDAAGSIEGECQVDAQPLVDEAESLGVDQFQL